MNAAGDKDVTAFNALWKAMVTGQANSESMIQLEQPLRQEQLIAVGSIQPVNQVC